MQALQCQWLNFRLKSEESHTTHPPLITNPTISLTIIKKVATQAHVRIAIAVNFLVELYFIEVNGICQIGMLCPNYPTFLEKKLSWEWFMKSAESYPMTRRIINLFNCTFCIFLSKELNWQRRYNITSNLWKEMLWIFNLIFLRINILQELFPC